MNKVTIIGTGSVGSTVAYTLASSSMASEIVLIDVNSEKALGEAMDIRQGLSFCGANKIYAGSYDDAVGSDVVIVTSGIARKPGQSRLDLTQTNVNIIKSIIPNIVKAAPDAIYIIVSNPVDIITHVFHKLSGLPENHIIGSGTVLDTSRLRARISEYYSINQQNVHAYVFGEHGDSSFVPWSLATITNVPMDDYHKLVIGTNKLLPVVDHDEVEEYIRTSGGKIISRKGATFYAVSLGVKHICKCIDSGMDTSLTVSAPMHGEYGIDDVCLSTLSIVGKNGLDGKILSPLTDEEIKKLQNSANILKNLISQLDI